jgi:hypothetical protein
MRRAGNPPNSACQGRFNAGKRNHP